jgi:hypothetical protein
MNHSLSRSTLAVLVTICLGAAACSSSGAPASASAAQDLTAADAPTSAIDVLRRGGTFMFAFEESAPSAYMRAKCAQEGASTADACYAQIADEARQEGLRFATDDAGHTVWTSFGRGGQVFLQVPLALSAEGNTIAVGDPVGPITGSQHHPATLGRIRFEVVDATTLVMNDPDKGKLVFHRVD